MGRVFDQFDDQQCRRRAAGVCAGVAGAVPTLGLLFYNGLVIGLFYSVFHDKGLGLDIIAWLSIHGVTEISAIFLGGAAGIHVGRGVLFPGRKSRSARLARKRSSRG